MAHTLTFDAVSEAEPGPKWRARWDRSWPAYEAWFLERGGDEGPSRQDCEAALAHHMPELLPVHAKLTRLAGNSDRAARFLSTWCPPPYLGGCSLAARAVGGEVRLVRNYDLAPHLNEGLLLRTEWRGMPVMGMVEFLWGLSDGINAAGLTVALAFGGRSEVAEGFGVTTILRYVLETCTDVRQAIEVLRRVPSHMAYNIVLADRHGATASVELIPGGGLRVMDRALATNHQHGGQPADRPGFTRTAERRAHLEMLFAREIAPDALGETFLKAPLFQKNYAEGFGTLFTAEYDPASCTVALHWPGQSWRQSLDAFVEGRREIGYGGDEAPTAPADLAAALESVRAFIAPEAGDRFDRWIAEARSGTPDWARFGALFHP